MTILSLSLSKTASQTAKNGFSAEFALANLLSTNKVLRDRLTHFRGVGVCENIKFHKIEGVGKIDISNGETHIQNKRTKRGQWQQADRHYLDYYLGHIPQWKEIETPLRDLLEAPITAINGRPDTSVLKYLTQENYSQEE